MYLISVAHCICCGGWGGDGGRGGGGQKSCREGACMGRLIKERGTERRRVRVSQGRAEGVGS